MKLRYKIALATAGTVLLLMAVFTTLSALNRQLPTPTTTAVQYAEPSLLDLVNQVRAKGGKPALSTDTLLEQAATARNAFIIDQGVWNHDGTNGEKWYATDQKYAPQRTHYGENLARCYQSNTDIVNGWVNSPTHYAILMGDFAKVGFSTVYETKTLNDTYKTPNQTFSNCYIVAAEFSN